MGNNETEQFRITAAGKVGIDGQNSPNADFHIGTASAVGDATNPALQFGGSNTYRLGMYTDSEGGYIENKNGDNGLIFRVKTAGEAMRINTSGNVGVGTTAPGATLHVDPAANVTTSLGSPLIKVGGDNSWAGNGSLYSIGFGYLDTAISNKSPAEIGIVTTSSTGYTKGALVFATRNTTGNDTPTERMRVSSDGYVTKSNHPCFVVHLGANTSYNSGVRPLNGSGWTSVHINQGNHFNTSTGYFTAPVTGLYTFTVNLCTNSAAGATVYWSAEIYTQASGAAAVRVLGGWNEHTAGYQRTEATYTRYLTAGTTVCAGMETANNITILGNAGSSPGGVYSRFEGYLIG